MHYIVILYKKTSNYIIVNNGANIKTVVSLLGHSGLTRTKKYTRVVDKLKEEAINSLSELKI